MKKSFLLLIVLVWVGFAGFSFAQDVIEQKAQTIDKKLIAPCCWTATLDQHFSEVAEQMKAEVRDRLSQGQSEEQILGYFEGKYGERILSQPKPTGFNLSICIFPFVALGFGAFLLSRVLRKTKPVEEVTNTMTVQTSSPERDEKYRKMIDKELYRS